MVTWMHWQVSHILFTTMNKISFYFYHWKFFTICSTAPWSDPKGASIPCSKTCCVSLARWLNGAGSHGDPLSCHRPTPKSLPEAIVFVYGWHFLSNEHSLNTDLCTSVVLHKGQCENTFKWRTSPNRCHISDTGAITLIHTLLWRFEDTCSLWECYAIMALWCIARPILADWLHKWHLGLISPSCTIFSRRYSSLNHQSESNHQPGTPPPNAFTQLRLFSLSVKYSQSFFSPHSRCSAPRAPSRRTGVWQEQLCRQ